MRKRDQRWRMERRTLVLLVEGAVAAAPAEGVALGVALTALRIQSVSGKWRVYGRREKTNPKDEVPRGRQGV
jgi:hypothetical protein